MIFSVLFLVDLMLRIFILLIVLLSFENNVNASTISQGFYVGIGAGMERMNGHRSERMDATTDIEAQRFNHKRDIKKHGYLASIFAGYLHRFSNFCLGGEVFYEGGRVEDKIKRNWVDEPDGINYKWHYSAALEKKSGFGIRANIGTVFRDQFFAYILLGLSSTQIRYNLTASLLADPNAYAQFDEAKRKLAYGFDYGLGILYQINKWRVGIEGYIRNIKSQTFSFKHNDPQITHKPFFHVTVKPIITAISVKASLTF